MILIDKEIKERHQELIVTGYNEKHVNPASYDVTIGKIILDDKESDSYELQPDTTIFIKTAEEIKMPYNMLGRIGEKNSRMRQGLWVSGPHYFPGHKTFMFLRVRNISPNAIIIRRGDNIAQIYFEQLDGKPDQTYDKDPDASFNDEDNYRGLGQYETEYNNRIRKVQRANEDLERMQGRIYANILTLMGLFVSIFSLIMVNFSQVTNSNTIDKSYLLTINLSLGFIISLFMGLILLFLNKGENKKWPLILWIAIVIALFIGVILI